MAVYFLDSSAVVKRYVIETGSAWVNGLVVDKNADGTLRNRVYLSSITFVEVTAALVRRSRGGSLSAADLEASLTRFRRDASRVYRMLRLTAAHLKRAAQLTEKHGLRGYDAVQLAAALGANEVTIAAGLPPIIFISADTELLAAASAEGFPVDDPNLHP